MEGRAIFLQLAYNEFVVQSVCIHPYKHLKTSNMFHGSMNLYIVRICDVYIPPNHDGKESFNSHHIMVHLPRVFQNGSIITSHVCSLLNYLSLFPGGKKTGRKATDSMQMKSFWSSLWWRCDYSQTVNNLDLEKSEGFKTVWPVSKWGFSTLSTNCHVS